MIVFTYRVSSLLVQLSPHQVRNSSAIANRKARRIAVIWLSLLNVGAPTIKHRTIENNLERSLPIPASFLVQEPRIGASPPIAAQESKA